jgi:xylose isomerase
MYSVVRQGGIAPGGLNFDAKVRRESTDVEDLFIGHIGAMDTFALALKRVAAMYADGVLSSLVAERYSSYTTGLGSQIESGTATFEDCHQYILTNNEPATRSGKQEKFEIIFNRYLEGATEPGKKKN